MQEFYGTKKLKAKPMTRGDYNKYRGWGNPKDENPNDLGYLVEYLDGGAPNHEAHSGYISWSPKDIFEAAYQLTTEMSFGHAITAMKSGKRVARAGWNGKNMFLYYVPAANYPAAYNELHTMQGEFPDDMVPYGAYIAMKTAQNNVIPWLASQTDMLADDWTVVDI